MTDDDRTPGFPGDCDGAREVLSARIDGEATIGATADTQADRHLRGCSACQMWEQRAWELRRTTRVRMAELDSGTNHGAANDMMTRMSVPDFGHNEWVRSLLGVVGGALVALHTPQLLGLGTSGGHDARHLGAFGVSLGLGLLWAAIRPERAIGLIPLAAALAGTMLVTSIVDLAAGRATMLGESTHTLEILGLGLVWWLSGGRRRLADRFAHGRRSVPIHSV